MKTLKLSLILVALYTFTLYDAYSQETQTLSGVVTSFSTIPLNNVRINASKSGITALSDQSGQFTIQISGNETVVFEAAGFKTKKIKPGQERNIKVELAYVYKPSSLQDATMNGHIAMDVLQKALENEELKKVKDFSKYSSIWELIDNEIYEVRVSGNVVYNNKLKSMDANPQVVYVVDEKMVNDISYINPIYVKSIEFVEDVGATLYGSRGANGVLKITLK